MSNINSRVSFIDSNKYLRVTRHLKIAKPLLILVLLFISSSHSFYNECYRKTDRSSIFKTNNYFLNCGFDVRKVVSSSLLNRKETFCCMLLAPSSRIFCSYGDLIIAIGLHNLGLCSTFTDFSRETPLSAYNRTRFSKDG